MWYPSGNILEQEKTKNYLKCVVKHEEQKPMRVGNELLQSVHKDDNPQLTPCDISRMYTPKWLKSKAESFENKPLHGYVYKNVAANNKIDQKLNKEWTTNRFMTLHFEAYSYAITEQEIGSKDLIHRREKLHQQPSTTDNKCRLCKKEVEDITHILASCSKMSVDIICF